MDNYSKTIKYAIIGCGRISPNHMASALANQGRLHIAAVCDVVEEHMDNILKMADGMDIKKYTDYKEMIEKEKPQLVAVCTESGKHAEIAKYTLSHGVNTIVEKPLALSLSDADEMIAIAKEHNVLLCACHQNRFNKSISKIREALEEGRFGRLLHATAHIRWNRGQDYYTQAPWRGTWEQDGGALMNQCIHNIDLLRWMMGDEITEVFAYTDNLNHDYINAEDLGMALVRFKNGGYGIIEGTTNVFPKNLEETLYIFGEKGTVKAGGKSVNVIEEWRFGDGIDNAEEVKEQYKENPPSVYGFGHKPLYNNVLDAIEGKAKLYVDGEAGRRALELVLAIYKSAAEHRPISLPLKECSTLDFKGRFKDEQ